MSHAKTERRRWRRVPASVLGNLSASIVGGPDARLVNLSRGGAQLEVAGRLPLRSFVRIKLRGAGSGEIVVTGRVAWAKVAAVVQGQVTYRVAIVFDELVPQFSPADEHGAAAALESSETDDAVLEKLAPFPAPAAEPIAVPARAEPPSTLEEPHAPGGDDAATRELRVQIAVVTENLARQSALNETLSARLKESYMVMAGLRSDWDAERRRLQEERAALAQQLTNELKRGDALQETLETREQDQARTIREQHDKYEELIAELVRANNEQQTEYQHLLEQLTAAQADHRRRAESHEAELAQLRTEAEQRRAELESRHGDFQKRLDAAEALCAAHHARYEELRLAAEKLLETVASPVSTVSTAKEAEEVLGCENAAADPHAAA